MAGPLIARARKTQQDQATHIPLWSTIDRTCELTGIARLYHVASSVTRACTFGDTGPFLHSAVQLTFLEAAMDTLTYTAVRANLARTMDRVCDDHEALIITRNGEQSVVMLSLEDYKALEETAYLLRTPANAKRLLSAVEQLTAGQVERKPAR